MNLSLVQTTHHTFILTDPTNIMELMISNIEGFLKYVDIAFDETNQTNIEEHQEAMKQLADHHVKILYQTRIVTNSMTNREVMAYLKTHKRPGFGG